MSCAKATEKSFKPGEVVNWRATLVRGVKQSQLDYFKEKYGIGPFVVQKVGQVPEDITEETMCGQYVWLEGISQRFTGFWFVAKE